MLYGFFRQIFRLILKLFFRFKVEGLENLPRTNFIVVANHTSFMDPPVLGAAIPQKIHWITLRQLYNLPLLAWFFRMTDAIPSGNSAEKAVAHLMEGGNVGLFPEGGISRDGILKDFKRGVALLAARTGRPIVPCAIFGTFQALPFGAKFTRFAPVKVKIGKPRYILKESFDIIDDIYLQEGIAKVRDAIEEMLSHE